MSCHIVAFIIVLLFSCYWSHIACGIIHKHFIIVSAAVTVSFDRLSYSINENSGLSQHVLVLSNPSSTNITVQVIDKSSTAIGK